MSDPFIYKRLSKDLLSDLCRLFKISNKNVSLEEMLRKYDTNSFGQAYVGFIAYDIASNQPAAFYGVIPVLANLNGKDVLIAQSADTLTHPDFRKRGLFVKLAKMTYSLCSECGIYYLFGIPNYNSFGGFVKKLDWENPDSFLVFEKKIKTLPLSYISNKNDLLKKLYRIHLKFSFWLFRIKNDPPFSIEISKNEFSIEKNSKYLDYKLQHLHFKIKIEDFVLVLSFNRYLKIGFISDEQKNLKKIHKKLRYLAMFTGCHKIVYQKHCSMITKSIENSFNGFKQKKGLPFIVKSINGQRDFPVLKIDFIDFDTF